MSNLTWIIPLAVWGLFLLVLVPYRLVSRYHNRHEDAINALLALYKDGKRVKADIYAQREDSQSVSTLYQEWGLSVASCFTKYRELGAARLLGMEPEKKDIIDDAPSNWGSNDLTKAFYLWVDAQLGLIKSLVQELLRQG